MVEVVWLKNHRFYAFLEERHAYMSIVYWYDELGEVKTMWVENSDYEFFEERAIEFTTDE